MSVNSFRDDETQKEVLNRETIVRLFKYLLAYKKQIFIVVLIMVMTTGIAMLNPLITERAIDVHIANKDFVGLIKLGVFAVLINLVFIVGVKARMIIMAKVSNQVIVEIREELYRHIQTLSFHFFDSRPTGKILARIIGDVNSLKDVLQDSVTNLVPELCTIISIIIIMLIKNVRLALSALITLPFLMIGMFLIETFSHKKWQIFRKKNSNLNAFLHENLSGIRIVQSFRAEEESNDTFRMLVNEQRTSFVNAVRINDSMGSLIEITWGLGGFLLYFIGIRIIGVGKIEIGTFIAFSTYLGMFWSPIRNLANYYNKMITNLSAAERVFDILDTPADIVDAENVYELGDIEGDVVFESVSFAYSDEPEKMVLNDVSFHVRPGETIALVGPTGAGKSTIVNLISRFYDVTRGTIKIDGKNLQDVSINSLRKQLGIMTQDNFLFSGTIKENIKYGKLNATDNDVIEAAKAVNAHDFIMQMENGYDTKINERGTRLSIGQRQLLAFARTMVSKPKILILDEATSSIDTNTEILVQKGIKELLKGRTSFIIAHRLSTIKNADRIFVINYGKIVEAGSHEELMRAKGEYYSLYQSQFKNL